MVDYVKLAATSLRLITKNGRSITFVNQDGTSSDPNKPWRGSGDPVGGGTDFITPGVFVPPNTVRQFGLTALGEGTEFQDLVAMSEQIIICQPGETDLRNFQTVIDRSETWGILGLQVLRPGPTVLLAFVGVRR